jgi:hypothetical protein
MSENQVVTVTGTPLVMCAELREETSLAAKKTGVVLVPSRLDDALRRAVRGADAEFDWGGRAVTATCRAESVSWLPRDCVTGLSETSTAVAAVGSPGSFGTMQAVVKRPPGKGFAGTHSQCNVTNFTEMSRQ